jgi:hypothetical protein
MFCPKCQYEFKSGITTCPECNVKLVDKLPDPPAEEEQEYIDLITVFTTSSNAELLVAKSLMEAAEVEYFAKGDKLADLIGGKLGFNPALGAYEIQVRPDDEEMARDILSEMDKDAEPLMGDGD